MTIQEKIEKLAYEIKLSKWERKFIANMYYGVYGTGTLHNEAIRDYLSDKRIDKVSQIYSKYERQEEEKEKEPEAPPEPQDPPTQDF